MKGDRASRTAHLVALGRAIANAGVTHVPGFAEPTAERFLDEKGKRSLESTVRSARDGKNRFGVRLAMAMADMMALRTMAIDAAVRDAIASGARQLVILGAGYDGRAWRLPELAGISAFEVDHPATQGAKRPRVASMSPMAASVAFVPVDFTRDSLDAQLDRAGHDRTQPTCWIWEGVVMYLTKDAMRATLANVGSRSARGSTLILNYHSPHRRFLTSLFFRLVGEPQISSWTPAEMASDLEGAGFRVKEDTGLEDWNRRLARGAADDRRGSYMRIAVAQAR